MNNPPSIRYQLWPQILFLAFVVWIPFSVLIVMYTWNLGKLELGPISNHIMYLRDHSWRQYKQVITDAGIQFQVVLRFALPCLFVLIASILFSLKLLWRSGGRDMTHHIAGPKLLEGKQAIRHARSMSRKEL